MIWPPICSVINEMSPIALPPSCTSFGFELATPNMMGAVFSHYDEQRQSVKLAGAALSVDTMKNTLAVPTPNIPRSTKPI